MELCSSGAFWWSMAIGFIVSVLLLKGSVLFISIIIQYIRTARYVGSFEKTGKEDYIEINSNGYEAFTYGLLRPKVYISSKIIKNFKNEEFQAVILHEKAHVASYDPLKYLLSRVVMRLLPRFPGKNDIFNNFEVLSELDADYSVERVLDTKNPLVSSLSKIMKFNNELDLVGISGFSFKSNRVQILTGREVLKSRFFLGALSTFAFGLLMLNAFVFMRCQSIMQCEIKTVSDNHIESSDNPSGAYCIHNINNQSVTYCVTGNKSTLGLDYSPII